MSELKKGDVIRVRTGSIIPVDGEICGGEGVEITDGQQEEIDENQELARLFILP